MSLTGTQSPDAACAAPSVDPELFTSNRADEVAEAKAICATCPIVEACLKQALANGHRGVWGGTTAAERAAMGGRRPARSHHEVKPRGGRPIKHGTIGGYATHRNRGEDACADCKAATTEYQKQLRLKRLQRQAQKDVTP